MFEKLLKKMVKKPKLTDAEKQDNLATFGVEDIDTIKISKEALKSVNGKVMTSEEWLIKNPPLEIPTVFSRQND